MTAAALDSLTTSTKMDTVVRLQIPSAELYLYYGKQTPQDLRRTLSPVFTGLRRADSAGVAQAPVSSERVIDRLHKLADLLDRGVLTEDEFACLKANLLSGT